jgi:serine/threonine protein kinase
MVTVDGLVKVTDFGIARVLGGERFTQTGVLVGTPEYMAPELWEGHEASKASDIYALGVLTYEMLTGEVPFIGTTPMAIGYKHVHEEVPVDKLRGIISDDALEALKISLAKSPERRFQSAVAFVRALKGQAFDLTQATKSAPAAIPEPSVSTASVSSTTPVSLLTPPTTVAVKRPRWLVWVAGFLFVLGLVVIILGGQVNRLLSERRLEQEIYKALEERRLISPPNDNALELYRRLRREFPNSATFQRVQAKVLNVLRDEIIRGFDNFYRTSKEDSQMWQELKKLCDWAVDIAPYDNWLKARQRYCYGRLEFLAKRYDNAILAYKEAIQNDPNWALPYNSIGVVYIKQKNWAKVVEWCSQAKKHDSDWVFPYLNVGWAFYNLRRYDEAEKEYRQAVELDPDRPTPYCRLSCLYEKKGWILDALEEAQKAMEVAEKNPDRWEEQIKDLQKRLERLRRKVGFGEGEGVYD